MLALIALQSTWLRFPADPPRADIAVGVAEARSERSLGESLGRRALTVSTRADGLRRRQAEAVLWLGPDAVARWLGWLSVREAWPEGELAARWSAIRTALDGQLWFLVQLAALPTSSFLELTPEIPPRPESLSSSEFAVEVGGMPAEIEVHTLGEWRSRVPVGFERFAWWRSSRLPAALSPRDDAGYDPPRFPLGECHFRWVLVRAILPASAFSARRFAFAVRGPRRERIVRFGDPQRPSPPVPPIRHGAEVESGNIARR